MRGPSARSLAAAFGPGVAVLLTLVPPRSLAVRVLDNLPLWHVVLVVCGGLLGTAVAAYWLGVGGRPLRVRRASRRTRGPDVLAAVLGVAAQGIVTVDAAGNVTDWNAAAVRLLGWNAEETLARPLPLVLEGGDGPREMVDAVLESGGLFEEDVRCRRKDGDVVLLRVSAAAHGGGFALVFDEAAAGNARGGAERAALERAAFPAERSRTPEEAQQRVDLLERVVAVGRTLHRPAGVAAVAKTIGEGGLALGADRVAVYVCQPDGTLTCPWFENLSRTYVEQVLRHAQELAAGHVMDGARPDLLEVSGRGIDAAGPVLYADIDALPPAVAVPRITQAEGYRSLGNWPLVYEHTVLGLLSCYYDAPRSWSEAEEDVLRTFGQDAALALHNAAMLDAQGQRAADLEVLFDLSRRLRAARNPEEIYPILLDNAMDLLHADIGTLVLLAGARAEFDCVAAAGMPPDIRAAAFPVSGSPFSRVAETGTTYQTANFGGQPLPVWMTGFRGIGPAVAVPVRSEEETIGVFCLGRKRRSDTEAFGEAEVRLFEGIAEIGGTAIRRARLFQNLEKSYMQMVVSLARTMDARDSYTSGHSERISEWAEAVAGELACGEAELQDIRWGALLHDIGKIGVPDAILRKPGKLTDAEWAIMRKHPEIGEAILASTERMRGVAALVRHHQEKWDGSGYPDGLEGDDIPLGARILAVCDAFSAITDDRPYKKARSREEGLAELRRCAGAQFDPRVVAAFSRIIDQAREREKIGRPR